MSEKRTVLVESISYLGTDGEDHVGVRGEHITVAKAGIEHFDWVHDATPEAQGVARLKAAEEAARPRAAAAPAAAKAADKA
jgi:hypothetical protein